MPYLARGHGPESGKTEPASAPSPRQTRVVDAKKKERKKIQSQAPARLGSKRSVFMLLDLHSFIHTQYVVQEAYAMRDMYT